MPEVVEPCRLVSSDCKKLVSVLLEPVAPSALSKLLKLVCSEFRLPLPAVVPLTPVLAVEAPVAAVLPVLPALNC